MVPCRCRSCWSRWRWPPPPGRSLGLHSGSPGRAPRSEPGGPLSSCSGWWAAPPGSPHRPRRSRQWRRSRTASRSPAHLGKRFKYRSWLVLLSVRRVLLSVDLCIKKIKKKRNLDELYKNTTFSGLCRKPLPRSFHWYSTIPIMANQTVPTYQ